MADPSPLLVAPPPRGSSAMERPAPEPQIDPEPAAVREQLERLVAHPLFRSSRRYPTMLRYVVEHRLNGGGPLKERTIGVEVLGREPDYDTNLDPVVRTSAGEIRKRIAQYYHAPGHQQEIRIDLPVGTYSPEFRWPPQAPALAEPVPVPSAWWRDWLLPGVILTLAALASLAIVIRPWALRNNLDRFWTPVLNSEGTALLCVGQRARLDLAPVAAPNVDPQQIAAPAAATPNSGLSLFQLYSLGSQNVAFPDVATLSRVAGLLHSKDKTYRIQGELDTNFADLREGPVILIGAFNNEWTMRLMGTQRFRFVREGSLFSIQDRKNPANRDWSVDFAKPYLNQTQDFALISRIQDPTTGRNIVVAGGLSGLGTVAAGELLTNAEFFESVTRRVPCDWSSRNLQVVISTKVINGSSGPPQVVAVHCW